VSLASLIVRSMRIFRRPDGRHYAISHPAPDLLGDLVIVTFHGSTTSGIGGVHTYLANQTTVDQIAQTRIRHGYVECSDLPSA
jgi:poly(3-hydroxybutyrate) depolymerase